MFFTHHRLPCLTIVILLFDIKVLWAHFWKLLLPSILIVTLAKLAVWEVLELFIIRRFIAHAALLLERLKQMSWISACGLILSWTTGSELKNWRHSYWMLRVGITCLGLVVKSCDLSCLGHFEVEFGCKRSLFGLWSRVLGVVYCFIGSSSYSFWHNVN